MDENIYWVNKPEKWEGDPDTGMEFYEQARSLKSFIDGSVETDPDEFSYLPGAVLIRMRE